MVFVIFWAQKCSNWLWKSLIPGSVKRPLAYWFRSSQKLEYRTHKKHLCFDYNQNWRLCGQIFASTGLGNAGSRLVLVKNDQKTIFRDGLPTTGLNSNLQMLNSAKFTFLRHPVVTMIKIIRMKYDSYVMIYKDKESERGTIDRLYWCR